MITVISKYDEKKDDIQIACWISTPSYNTVQEIEGVLFSILEQKPDEFLRH